MAADDTAIKQALITIKVFGVGGGGNNVLESIAEAGFSGIELIAVNTDIKQLRKMDAAKIKTVQIGEALTKGLGAGGKPEIGMRAARREEEFFKDLMQGADLIFITAAMGGGTGTGAAPFLAQLARDLGILTVGVVTMPFGFEGKRKMRIAEEAVARMQANIDALVVVRNDNLMKLPDNRNMSFVEAFHAADEVLKQAINCVVELILTTGVVNVDFADVSTVFRQSESSDALLGIGQSEISAVTAVQEAVESPLIEKSLKGARGMILNITGDETLTLCDVSEATEYIYKQTGDDVNIIFGTVIDHNMNGVIQATIIATDFSDSVVVKAPRPRIYANDFVEGETPDNNAYGNSVPANNTPVNNVAANNAPTNNAPVNNAPPVQPDFNLSPPSFMMKNREKTGEKPSEGASGGAFAIPAFKLTQDDNHTEDK